MLSVNSCGKWQLEAVPQLRFAQQVRANNRLSGTTPRAALREMNETSEVHKKIEFNFSIEFFLGIPSILHFNLTIFILSPYLSCCTLISLSALKIIAESVGVYPAQSPDFPFVS